MVTCAGEYTVFDYRHFGLMLEINVAEYVSLALNPLDSKGL